MCLHPSVNGRDRHSCKRMYAYQRAPAPDAGLFFVAETSYGSRCRDEGRDVHGASELQAFLFIALIRSALYHHQRCQLW
jgi:hypothetical protein